MAEITIVVQYEGDDHSDSISTIIDNIAEAAPSGSDFGLQVDGEHRDPDAPGDTLF